MRGAFRGRCALGGSSRVRGAGEIGLFGPIIFIESGFGTRMPVEKRLPEGLYEALLDQELQSLIDANPEMIPTLVPIDDEESPQLYSQFIGQVVKQALRNADKEDRRDLVNQLIDLLSAQDGLKYTRRKRLLVRPKSLLREVRNPLRKQALVVPNSPMSVSSLLTGAGDDPQLEREIRVEMMSADRVDILVSFIKWSGLRLLIPAFEDLVRREVPVRVITTSYMGASDAEAVEWLARQSGFTVRVSYDTGADPSPCESLSFCEEERIFHGLHRVGQHVGSGDDQRSGMDGQGDRAGHASCA